METSIMLKVKTDLWDTLYIYSDLMIMDMDGMGGCYVLWISRMNKIQIISTDLLLRHYSLHVDQQRMSEETIFIGFRNKETVNQMCP